MVFRCFEISLTFIEMTLLFICLKASDVFFLLVIQSNLVPFIFKALYIFNCFKAASQ